MTLKEISRLGLRFRLPVGCMGEQSWSEEFSWYLNDQGQYKTIWDNNKFDGSLVADSFEEIPLYFRLRKDWYLHPDDQRRYDFRNKLTTILELNDNQS